MSLREEIERLRQLGMDTRERVLNGDLPAQAPAPRARDFIRNRQPTQQSAQQLPPLDGVGMMQESLNNLRSPASPIASSTPAAAASPQLSREQYLQQQSDKRMSNDFFPMPIRKGIDAVAGGIDRLLVNNPVGRFINRFSQGAGSAVGVDTQAAGAAPLESTGNRATDFTADITGQIAGTLTNPSNIGQGLVQAPYRVGQQVAQMFVPKAPQLAQRAIEGATAGAIQGGVISGVRGETDAKELATNIGFGAATGAIADPLVSLLGKGAQRVLNKYRPEQTPAEPMLALPEGRLDQRIRAAQQRGTTAPGTEPIIPEYTFGLPKASGRTAAIQRNVKEARADLKTIDDEIRQLNQRYEAAVVDEYKFLQESMKTRGGVQQGNVIRNADGEVVSRYGRQSNNPQWFQDFFAENGRVPRNRDLLQLARQRVDNGFNDSGADVPSWRQQNGYDEAIGALQQVRETINTSLRELDPALRVTDAPLRSSELSFTPPTRSPRADSPSTTEPVVSTQAAMPEPTAPVRPDLPPIPEPGPMAAADQSLGITPAGTRGRYTNPEDTRGYIATKTEREPLDLGEMVNRFYERTVDSLQRINTFDKTVEQLSGKKLSAADRAYVLGLNSRGADVTSRHILTERLVDARGNVIGPSLKDITQQIPNGAYDNFSDYLIAKHAETRMARDETVYNRKANMDETKLAAKISQYEQTYPQFKGIADQIYSWNANMRQSWLVDTGVIPQEMADAWAKANPYWIPNQRKFSQLEKGGRRGGAKRGFANQNNPVKKYSPTGSERDIIDPFESLIEYTDRYVKTARRNEVMQTIVRSIQRYPDDLDGFATILRREPINKKAAAEGLDDLIDELDQEFLKATNNRLKKNDLTKDNVVSTLIDGQRVYMRIEDPALLDAMTNLGPQAGNAIVEGARKATNTVKLLTTGINPIFGLTRNIFRDIPEAYIFSKTTDNPFRYAIDTLEGFISVFADGAAGGIGNSRVLQRVTPKSFREWVNKKATLYRDYKALGGGHSSPVATDRNLLAQTKRDLLPQRRGGVRGVAGRAYGALENLNNALESGPRLGEFKRTRQAGKDTYSSRVGGVFAAQDVTTNFKRSGDWTRDADAFILYMNAAVQGLDKFVRAFKDRPAAVSMKATAAIALPTIALYALNHDNPEYQKLSNYNKDNFFLFPTDEPGKFIKIPKPRELGVPFGGLMERTLKAWAEDDPDAFRDFAETAKTMFAPPFIGKAAMLENPFRDTIAGPIIDVTSNKNFIDAPIVPGYLEGLSPRLQYDANTSEVSKWIGDKINRSPKQIDHLIRSYTGVIGQVGLPATTQGATLGDTLTKQVTADSAFSTDAGKFFYELKDKLDTQYKDYQATGNVPKGYDDDARRYMGRVAQVMSDYTRAIREIDNDKSMPRNEKRDQKRELTAERNEIARQVYQQIRDQINAAK